MYGKIKSIWTGFANAIFFDAVCSGFDVRLIAFRKRFAGVLQVFRRAIYRCRRVILGVIEMGVWR